MPGTRYITLWFLALIGWFGCEKNPPEYTLIRPGSSDRTVLIEEFSGARCPNCPQGTQELENLKALYGGQLVIVTVHAGDFAFTYPESNFDFTTEGGDELLAQLGNPIGYPSAVINRMRVGESYQAFSTRWGSLISEALEAAPVASINQQLTFDPVSRELEVTITVLPFEDMDRPLLLTSLIKEDSIVDPQADRAVPAGVVPNYVHKNVLRRFLSDVAGDLIAATGTAFQAIEKTYRFELPAEHGWWRAEQCWVVSFVSLESGAELNVLQAAETKIVDR